MDVLLVFLDTVAKCRAVETRGRALDRAVGLLEIVERDLALPSSSGNATLKEKLELLAIRAGGAAWWSCGRGVVAS